jgi:hypothetical protein
VTRRRGEMILLALLLLTAAGVYLSSRSQGPGLRVIAADEKFQPLSVREPQLRLDELVKLQKSGYNGSHRNIFVATLPPPEPTPAAMSAAANGRHPIYTVPMREPDPPLTVPVQFFGYAFSRSGGRVAFFTAGEDVLVVPEGDTFLNRFRVVKIGTDSVDVDEVSSGKRARLPMLQPAADSASGVQPPTPGAFQPGVPQ